MHFVAVGDGLFRTIAHIREPGRAEVPDGTHQGDQDNHGGDGDV